MNRGSIPKTAVVGADGYLGSQLFEACRSSFADCVGTSYHEQRGRLRHLDLRSPDIGPLRLSETGHRWAIVAAAVTGVDRCLQEQRLAWEVNVRGTLRLLEQLVESRVRPVFVSSDYVFGGDRGDYGDDDEVAPTTEYGRQKAAVEEAVRDRFPEVLVVRFSKLYDLKKGDGTLLDEMAAALTRGDIVQAAYDQRFCPTYIGDVVRVLRQLQLHDATGVLNVSSPEVWRRYELALALAKALRVDPRKVRKVSLSELPFAQVRPRDTSMRCVRLQEEVVDCRFTPMVEALAKLRANYTDVL